MAKHKNIILENVTKELVTHFLEREVPPEVVIQTSKNARHISYHCKSLDVNTHAVKRMLDGIILKMRVNGYQEKALKLSKAAHKWLSPKSLVEKSDLKWELLSFILQLGEHPARSDCCNESQYPEIENRIPIEESMFKELALSASHYLDQDESLSEWSEDEMKSSFTGCEFNIYLDNSETSIYADCYNAPYKEGVTDTWLTNNLQNYWSDKSDIINLPELAIMRECLWSLIYPSSGVIFTQSCNGEFILGPFTALDISQPSLISILQPVFLCLKSMKSINEWIEKNSYDVFFSSGILDSYATGLLVWRNSILKHLISIERMVTKEEKNSLAWLLHELEPIFMNIALVYRINKEAFDVRREGLSSGLNLLGILIQTLDSSLTREEKQIVFNLFMCAMRHHFRILESWLCNHDFSSLHLEEFGITAKSLPIKRHNLVESFYSEDDAIVRVRDLKFLVAVRPILINIFDLNRIIKSIDADYLFSDSLDNIEELVCSRLKQHLETNTLFKTEIIDSNSIGDHNKSVSALNSECSSSSSSNIEYPFTYPDKFMEKAFENDNMSSNIVPSNNTMLKMDLIPEVRGVECVLTDVLTTLVESHSKKVGKGFMSLLINKYKSRDHVRVFKSIMLMEAGDLMREFYSYVFNKINKQEPLEVLDLTARLQYCVEERYSDFTSNFTVILSHDLHSVSRGQSEWATTDLNSIYINYEVGWPVSLIINEETVILYNQLFAFCLNLKRSVSALENLRFKDLGRNSNYNENSHSMHDSCVECLDVNKRFHRLCLLRHWLLFFARAIHDHFNASIILLLSQKIDSLWNDDIPPLQFLNEHVDALRFTCRQCFLSEENKSPIQIAISGAFSIIEEIRILWYGPPHKISDAKLLELEDSYATCHRCLARLLNFISKKDSIPHVDALMETLSGNIPI